MIRRLLPTLLVVVSLGACAKQPDAAPAVAVAPDTAAIRAELATLNDAYHAALLAGDAAALNAFYTDDAVVELTGIPTMVGRAAIMTADSTALAMGKPTESSAPMRTMAMLGNGAVAQTGTWSDAAPAGRGKTSRRAGRWVASFVKGENGKWRINYLMAMTDSTTVGK